MLNQLRKLSNQSKPPLSFVKNISDEKAAKLADFIIGQVGQEVKYLEDGVISITFELIKNGVNHILVARGITEDFKVLLNGQLVMESMYDNYFNMNDKLLDFILD